MSAALKIAAPPSAKITWAEYQKMDAASEVRLEFVNGEVYAMAGSNDTHSRIVVGLTSELHQALKGKACEAFNSDMKLRIELGADELGYYPDAMVVCDPNDRNKLYRTSPKVIFEVLSKSTRRIDTREKFLAYQAVASLEVYVMIEQARKRAIIHRRSNNWWPEIIDGDEGVITLDEIGVKLSFADIYARVDWSEQEPESA